MIDFAYIFAAIIIVTPPQPMDMTKEIMHSHVESIRMLALEWQLIDPHEGKLTSYAFVSDFQDEVNFIRRRFQELKDAPRTEDRFRFPPYETIASLWRFNREYHSYLESQKLISSGDYLQRIDVVQQDNNELFEVWTLIHNATSPLTMIPQRRVALKKLRETIGHDNYYAARFPPSVPIWYFQTKDK